MAIAGGQEDGEPMMDINTTPLIDVMLVLLIMFIITIPPQTHAVKVNLPIPDITNPPIIDPIKNRLYIDPASQLFWNGQPINDAILAQYLNETANMPKEPQLEFEPDRAAPYSTVDQVMVVIHNAGVNNLGFVGNENYANFAKATRPADQVDQ